MTGLESTARNLPFVKERKVIFAYWLRQYSGEKADANIITASDVLN